MASKTRSKADVRTGKGKAGRRPPVKVKSASDLPILPIAVAGILLVFAIGILIYVLVNNKPTPGPASAGGVPCDSLEHTQVHYHAALQIVYQGIVHPIPQNIGIVTDSSGNPTCYYWLHVHPANTDTIHIESPANQTFTLGQFFQVWSTWSKAQGGPAQPLDATHVSTIALTPDQKLVVYIDLQDGKGAQVYTGDPKTIVLKAHEVITLEITPPEVTPPPPFTFASGL
jgi:hypothetical protein